MKFGRSNLAKEFGAGTPFIWGELDLVIAGDMFRFIQKSSM
jgi:hypothetical protein